MPIGTGGAQPQGGSGNVLRAIRVIVPGGTHYRGEVRAVTWR
jgi:hypothetical protein